MIWRAYLGVTAITVAIAPVRASAQTGVPTSVRAVAVCYALTLGEWRGRMRSGSTDWHEPPRTFRLDTIRSTRRPASYAARPRWVYLDPRRTTLPPWWHLYQSDSLEVVWSTGFSGVTVSFAIRGDSLVGGRAQAFADVRGETQPWAPAAAVRMTCPPEFRAPG